MSLDLSVLRSLRSQNIGELFARLMQMVAPFVRHVRYFWRIFSRTRYFFFSRSFATRTRDNLANVASRVCRRVTRRDPESGDWPDRGRAQSRGDLVNFYGENLTSRRGPDSPSGFSFLSDMRARMRALYPLILGSAHQDCLSMQT